ncbi:hypothetical protein HDU86_000849 [Geranomyces michiganensis]|nr:hypothetical protein HDU86_000849 [Geranomyces michiganensis]
MAVTTVAFTSDAAAQLLARLNHYLTHNPPSAASPRPASLLGVLALDANEAPANTADKTGYIVLISDSASTPDDLCGAALVLDQSGGDAQIYPWLRTDRGGSVPAETVNEFVKQTILLARKLKQSQKDRGMVEEPSALLLNKADREEEPLLFYAVSGPVFAAIRPHVETSFLGKDYDLWEIAAALDDKENDDKEDNDGRKYILDSLRAEDYDNVASEATIHLSRAYFAHLVESPILRDLHRVVRCCTDDNNGDKGSQDQRPAVSWCLTHGDRSVGLIGTLPPFRKRGLARWCSARVTALQQSKIVDNNPCFAYIDPANAGSRAMMQGIGYRLVPDTSFVWFGVYVAK